MGICSSCLGWDRRDGSSDEDEGSRLLFDDPSHSAISGGSKYGTFGDQATGVVQEDPQDVQRETEALQKIVALTSSHLVDIFAMVPQTSQRGSTTTYTAHDARLLRFQDVLAKMSTEPDSMGELPAGIVSPECDGWIVSGDETGADNEFKVVKSEEIGPLLGGFTDIEPRRN